jgi:hypothetical protein
LFGVDGGFPLVLEGEERVGVKVTLVGHAGTTVNYQVGRELD